MKRCPGALKMIALVCLLLLPFGKADAAHAPSGSGVALDGTWEFHWQALLTPEELDRARQEPMQVPVPSSWHAYRQPDGQALPKHGYATYRKRVPVPPEAVGIPMSLTLDYVGSAYRIWIDGRLAGGMGEVGTSAASETPRLGVHLIEFIPTQPSVDLVLQVSNYSFREGGIIGAVAVADTDRAHTRFIGDIFVNLFLIGGFVIVGLYHLIIYVSRRTERAILFIGIGALLAAVRTLLVNEYLTYYLIPAADWTWMVKTEYLAEIAIFFMASGLMKALYPEEIHPVPNRIAYVCAAMLGVYSLIVPTQVLTGTLTVHATVIAALILYYVFYVGILAAIRQREGARLNLFGLLAIALAILNDTMNYTGVWHTFMAVEYSIMTFILLQAVIVSYRYSLLKANLEQKVYHRTRELHRKNEELAQSQTARTKMLSNIAHDLNSPLVGIQMYLQLMKDGMLPAADSEALSHLLDKSDDMKRLVDRLFELSKLESRELKFQLESVPAREFVEEAHKKFAADLAARSIELRLGRLETMRDGRQVCVRADRFQLMRILQNYIDNAVKFSEPQVRPITLSCSLVENLVRMEVTDQGRGLTPEEMPLVFQRFYKKREGNEAGSGLGLAIVREIAEQLGGNVGVDSRPGEGSCFYVLLPVAGCESQPS